MDEAPTIWRYTCTACGLVVRVAHQARGIETVACACSVDITEEQEPYTEPGA